ncbi:MAG: hypothetical protein ACJ766_15545 [Thermoleophilaceae bacterium]|jgi:hypothetical protein
MARGGLWALARLVSIVTSIVVALIVIGIVLVLLEANTANQLVNSLLDAARWLTTPFHNVFKLHGHKANIGVNWGLAAVVYAFAGGVIARLLRR